jgi:hypothetical protein
MLTKLHGVVERLFLRVYRDAARQLHAERINWHKIEILCDSSVWPQLVTALDYVQLASHAFPDLLHSRLKAIICVDGAMTKTLPVSGTFLIDPKLVSAMETEGLAFMLVQSAAYIDFYSRRSFFFPRLFFRGRDRVAWAKASDVATGLSRERGTDPGSASVNKF